MSDPLFDGPDADDTIRRPLTTAQPRGREGAPGGFARAGFDPGFDTGFDRDFDHGFAAAQGGRRGYMDEGFADDFGFAGAAAEPMPARGDPAVERAFDLAAINPLAGAAAPLLWLAGRLNESAPPEHVAQFRERVRQELKRFETAAMARDVPPRLVRMGRYALAATIDDIILNTAWGGQTAWASRSLVSLLYNETWGGERFYDLLSQMRLNAEDNIDGLELMAICLAVGFSGKYRVMEGGLGKLSRLRHELYRTIRRIRGPHEQELSPPWEAVAAPHAAPKSARGAWIVAGAAALLVAILWIASSIGLRARVETAAERIDALSPGIAVTVARPAIPVIPERSKPDARTQLERLSGFLAPEIAAGRVEVARVGDRIVIRMLQASFPTGGVALAGTEEPLVTRIGAALDGEKGPILVVGHTDDIPVTAGSALGDNMAISQQRARSTAEMLRRHVGEPERVSSEGRGSNDPIASNATVEGRSRNRRVEFWIDAQDGA